MNRKKDCLMNKNMDKSNKIEKNVAERIKRIEYLCKNHFGDVKFVGIKYQINVGWIAKVQFTNNNYFSSLAAEGKTDIDALRNLKKRIKKIINRYAIV